MRASALPKKYGWGVHYDSDGEMAIYPVESDEYRRMAEGDGGRLQVLPAMRSRRAT